MADFEEFGFSHSPVKRPATGVTGRFIFVPPDSPPPSLIDAACTSLLKLMGKDVIYCVSKGGVPVGLAPECQGHS